MDDTTRRGHAALRRGRTSIAHQVYLVTAVTHGRAPLFADWRTGRLVVNALRRYRHAAETLCYVVMPDHLHWLLRLEPQYTLSQVVRGVKGNSSYEIGRRQATQGHVWQPGFHDRALRADEDLQAAARYIVANPLRAGLVRRLVDYPLWDAVWL
jgi:putative transposase